MFEQNIIGIVLKLFEWEIDGGVAQGRAIRQGGWIFREEPGFQAGSVWKEFGGIGCRLTVVVEFEKMRQLVTVVKAIHNCGFFVDIMGCHKLMNLASQDAHAKV